MLPSGVVIIRLANPVPALENTPLVTPAPKTSSRADAVVAGGEGPVTVEWSVCGVAAAACLKVGVAGALGVVVVGATVVVVGATVVVVGATVVVVVGAVAVVALAGTDWADALFRASRAATVYV